MSCTAVVHHGDPLDGSICIQFDNIIVDLLHIVLLTVTQGVRPKKEGFFSLSPWIAAMNVNGNCLHADTTNSKVLYFH